MVLHHLVSSLVAGITHRNTIGIGAGSIVLPPHRERDDVFNRPGIRVFWVQWSHDGIAGWALLAVTRPADLHVPEFVAVRSFFAKFLSVLSWSLEVGMSMNKKMHWVVVVGFNHVYHKCAGITRNDSNP